MILCLLLASATVLSAETKKLKKSRVIKVLTYNIRGLPWPASTDRGRYKAIGKLIKKRKPDFVLLQEAFTRKSKRKVSKYAGYKNNIHGPRAKFLRDIVGSGVSILTNHEVLDYKKDSLDYCDPTECIARKSIMGIRSKIEGMPYPINIINIHQHAQTEHDEYRKLQIEHRVMPFMEEDMSYHNNLNIYGGDLNFKPKHESYWFFLDLSPYEDVSKFCIDNQDTCEIELGEHPKVDMNNVYKTNNDRMFTYNPKNSGYEITPVKFVITGTEPFKNGLKGNLLSDHWAMEVHYKISWYE